MFVAKKSMSERYISMINPVSFSAKYGKHKVKRYLYHFTSLENYQKMLESKKINMSKDRYLEKPGVFMVDLPNLTNQWLNNDTYWGTQNLALTLIRETSNCGDKLVCLRIPTEKLDHSKLKVRSQSEFFEQAKKLYGDVSEHLRKGDEAKNRGLYTQRKDSVEHIYQGEIPLEDAELVGIADIDKNKVCYLYNERGAKQKNIVIDVLQRLFKGQPEEKGINYLA